MKYARVLLGIATIAAYLCAKPYDVMLNLQTWAAASYDVCAWFIDAPTRLIFLVLLVLAVLEVGDAHRMHTRTRVQLHHPNARTPTRATSGAAGYDLYACERVEVVEPGVVRVPTGVALQIPPGFYGRIADRSSYALKGMTTVAGTIDSDYRGPIVVLLRCAAPTTIEVGDRVAQIIVEPHTSDAMYEAPLDRTSREAGGFGSTGK